MHCEIANFEMNFNFIEWYKSKINFQVEEQIRNF